MRNLLYRIGYELLNIITMVVFSVAVLRHYK